MLRCRNGSPSFPARYLDSVAGVIERLKDEHRAFKWIQAPEHVTPDGRGGLRISSGAFTPKSDGTSSVDLEEALLLIGNGPMPLSPPVARTVGMVAHLVETYRGVGYEVAHRPLDGRYCHGAAYPINLSNSQIRRAARALRDACELIGDLSVTSAADTLKQGEL